jgi:enoyl-CoA hydratase/carnithine racemase
MSDDDIVTYEVADGGVATITLNRPERRNGWSPMMERRFYDVLAEAETDSQVRVAVLTGAGKSFCPGLDSERLDQVAGHGLDLTGRVAFSRTLAFRKPLIAAINGGTAGIGLVQALMCDVRFASRTARMTTAFARRGLPAEHGLSWLLPRLVGLERAMDLLLSARTFDADEALRIGLVAYVTEPDDLMPAALAYARDIAANCSPTALSLIKHQVLTDLDSHYRDALSRAYRAATFCAPRDDCREGVDAFMQKRSPEFAPLAADFSPAAVTGQDFTARDIDPKTEAEKT